MLLHKGNVKRLLCALLACTLLMVPVTPASASTARATTMKLEKKEGTVTLKTQSGTSLRITNGMRLYNGNSLSTGKSSYAYISLDSSKAVKLDQNSSATLRQSGSSLELLTKSGKLFFNVSKPLTKKESMNVRISTMVTGIRGTCGVVEATTQTQSKLYLIEGKVTLGSGDQAVTVNGGQVATVVKGAHQPVSVDKLTEKDIPAVALQEIVNDTALQEKIEQTTDLEIEKIREAFEQLQKEEADGNDSGKTDQDQKDNTKNDEDTSGSSSGGSSTPSQPSIKEVVLTGTVTSGAIEAAFQENELVHIGFGTNRTGTLSLQAGETLEVPGGKRLHIWGSQSMPGNATIKVAKGGLLCVPEGAVLGGNGNVHLLTGSTLEVHGTLDITALTSDGGATIKNSNKIKLSGGYRSTSDNYAGETGVLISVSESTGLSSGGWLLMTAKDSAGSDCYYYYAKTMCRRVVENMKDAKDKWASWNFAKDAIIPVGDSVSLGGFRANMNGNAFDVRGTLRLEDDVDVTGSGAATIRLSGGNLVFDTKNAGSADGTKPYSIANTSSDGYVIARENSGTVTWKNVNITLKAAGGLSRTMQGLTGTDDQIRQPDYCILPVAYTPVWDSSTTALNLKLNEKDIPSNHFGSGDSVSTELLNAALQYHDTVTLDQGVTVELKSDETLTIPAGKTLKSSGILTGSGIIAAAGGSLTNSGSIDVKALSLSGKGTITNEKLIRVRTCSASGSDRYQYVDPQGEGVLIIDGYGMTGDTMSGAQDLVCVMAKNEQSTGENDIFVPIETIYAPRLNKLAAAQMRGGRIVDGKQVVQCNFRNDAVVSDDLEWDLAGAGVGMANFTVQVEEGKHLTLKNIGSVGGTGAELIHLATGAALTVTGDSASSTRVPVLSLNSQTGYVIAMAEKNASAGGNITARITLSDPGLTIYVSGTKDHLIQGMSNTDANELPGYVELGANCRANIEGSDSSSSLKLLNN